MSSEPAAGRVLAGRYRLGEQIARGGMATVWRARDDRLERDVAIKVLRPPYADDPSFVERFLGEARLAGSITHPSLAHVYDSGSDEGLHYIVMELLEEHRSLRDVLDERGRLGVSEAVDVARQVLAGLTAIHAREFVHADVKPGNVMLGPGPAKLIDFGIARTRTTPVDEGTSLGSLHAMSPEQLRGEPLTPASDVFAVGAVLYEALTGRVPYPGTTPEEVVAAQDRGGVRPPSTLVAVPPALDAAVLTALSRTPQRRFADAGAMDEALEAAIGEHDAEETTTVRTVRDAPAPVADAGYVPPAVEALPAPEPVAASRPPVSTRAPTRRPARASRSALNLAGPLLFIGVAAVVLLIIVIPLLQGVRQGGGGAGTSPSAGATPTPATGATVVVPDTIGLGKDEAIAAAEAAGLDWTIRCEEDPSRPGGMVDQEPPAGGEVRRGSPFTMFSARIADCR